MTQQYSLRWNNHQPNFISMFTSLLNTQTLVDVTLAAEGKHLQAHKVVLSACSNYFQALFMDNPSRHPIVILKDVTFADLRTMVDFMYYGEVHVTEEQLPQVLDTAKTLKIKGLTEMPDSTSVTRSQGTSADFPSGELQEQRHLASPAHSPRRRKRRKSSTGSLQLTTGEEGRGEECGAEEAGRGPAELVRGDAITLSSVPRRRDYHDHQAQEAQNMNVEQLGLEANTAGMTQESSSSSSRLMSSLKLRRSKYLKRQSRVTPEQGGALRKQVSEPAPPSAAPPSAAPPLQKHESYPQYKNRRVGALDQEVGSVRIRAVTVIDRQATVGATATTSAEATEVTTRASHTPAVRSGPPLSCNFCWNTVDECGRILRRKTQYHCPECRTNLCIVPCFHEYHDGAESDAAR